MNPIIFAAKPNNTIVKKAIDKTFALRGTAFDYWKFSICKNLWQALDEEFDGKFAPSNRAGLRTTPAGQKVQLLKEDGVVDDLGNLQRVTIDKDKRIILHNK